MKINTISGRMISSPILATVLAAIFACVFSACDSPVRDDTLRWRSMVDVPVNLTLPVGRGVNDRPAGLNAVVLDLGTNTIPMQSDLVTFLRKLTRHEAGYDITISNNSGAELRLYALLFREGDEAAGMGAVEFYDLVRQIGVNDDHNRENLFKMPEGFALPPGLERGLTTSPNMSSPLASLMLNRDGLSWRWIALVNDAALNGLSDVSGTDDFLGIRLRIKVSGVNSFDSLLTM